MTSPLHVNADRPTAYIAQHRPRIGTVLAVAVVSGVILGALDLLAQRELAYPWANLANSSAVWAIAAFAIGSWVARDPLRSMAGGVVLLLVAIESYYVTASLVQDDSWSNLVASPAIAWLAFGLVAGLVFGAAGAWSRTGLPWQRIVGVSLPVAVLLAEAALQLHRSGAFDARHWNHDSQTAVIKIVLAIVVLVLTTRDSRRALLTFLVSLPFAVIGFGGFVAAGFSGFGR